MPAFLFGKNYSSYSIKFNFIVALQIKHLQKLAYGYIIIRMEKEYLNYLNNLDAEASGLLGFFDSDGQYIIEQDIIAELIECTKIIRSYSQNKIEAQATIDSAKFNFIVYIQDGENNKKRAGLFLQEKGKLGFIEKELQTYVDSVILENTTQFFAEVKKRFHLITIDESEGEDINNVRLSKITARLKKLAKKYKGIMSASVEIDKAYVIKMLSILKASGPYGQNLLMELKKQIAGKKLNKSSISYWREVKYMLDKMMFKNESVFNAETLAKMAALQKNYIKAMQNVKEPAEIIETVAPGAKKAKKKAPKKKKKDDGGKKKKKKPAGKDKKAAKGKESGGGKKPETKSKIGTKSKIDVGAVKKQPPKSNGKPNNTNSSLFLGVVLTNNVSKDTKEGTFVDTKRRKLVSVSDKDGGLSR